MAKFPFSVKSARVANFWLAGTCLFRNLSALLNRYILGIASLWGIGKTMPYEFDGGRAPAPQSPGDLLADHLVGLRAVARRGVYEANRSTGVGGGGGGGETTPKLRA